MKPSYNEPVYERLILRAEQYLKDAQRAKSLGWVDCVQVKIRNAVNHCKNRGLKLSHYDKFVNDSRESHK